MGALKGKKILLAASGGIALYKCCELVRLLAKEGAGIRVAMTEGATRFVAPLTFEALSGLPVATSLWEGSGDPIPHIRLAAGADLIIVAPATANIIAKAANGIADDLVSTLLLARKCPAAVVPAMNTNMWLAEATQRNIAALKKDGFMVWGPAAGGLACGDSGEGRMIEPSEIAALAEAALTEKYLAGKTVLVTAGPTFEPMDPVRGITNLSSGKQGFAIAREAAAAGAAVTIVAGPVREATPPGVERVNVTTALEMLRAVEARAPGSDIFVGVAAVSDWRPEAVSPRKIKKTPQGDPPPLRLIPNPDIASAVGHLPPGIRPVTVVFAAETENVEENARAKLSSKAADIVVGNRFTDTFGKDTNSVVLVTRDGAGTTGEVTKREAARIILERAAAIAGNELG